jgi:hypothetical protein
MLNYFILYNFKIHLVLINLDFQFSIIYVHLNYQDEFFRQYLDYQKIILFNFSIQLINFNLTE